MSRFFMLSLACLLSVFASTAQASVLSKYLTFDGPVHLTSPIFQGGGEDFLQDDSVSAWDDRDLSGDFSDGDVVWQLPMGRYSPGIATERTYFFSLNGRLLALRGRDAPKEQTPKPKRPRARGDGAATATNAGSLKRPGSTR